MPITSTTLQNSITGAFTTNQTVVDIGDEPIIERSEYDNINRILRERISAFRTEFGIHPDHIVAHPRTLAQIRETYIRVYGILPGYVGRIYEMTEVAKPRYPEGKVLLI